MNVDKNFAKLWANSSTISRTEMELDVISDLGRAKAEYLAKGGVIHQCANGETEGYSQPFILPSSSPRTVTVKDKAA